MAAVWIVSGTKRAASAAALVNHQGYVGVSFMFHVGVSFMFPVRVSFLFPVCAPGNGGAHCPMSFQGLRLEELDRLSFDLMVMSPPCQPFTRWRPFLLLRW